jgi:transglutaminase-like putative cysteine protease
VQRVNDRVGRLLTSVVPLLLITSIPALAGTNIPDWVRQAAGQSLPTYDRETKAVVLLDDISYAVAAPGEYTEHYRRVVKILRPEGRHEADFSMYVHRGEKISALHAWAIDSSGREFELKEKDFIERSPYSYDLYDDIHLHTTTAPGGNPGAVVAFEYEARRHRWLNQLHWFFEEESPVRLAHLATQLPPGWEYKTFWAGTFHVEPVQAAGNRWEWTLRDVPGIQDEPRMPGVASLAARMELAYFPSGGATNSDSWDSLGRWYLGLTVDRRSASAEISARARELTSGKNDFDGKVRQLASFLQSDIRYVAIEIGIGGYQPHSASDVYRFRYGDCKDKATLLSSMLQEVGIRSDYVLIHTQRGVTKPNVPSAVFDHAILAIELPADTPAEAYRAIAVSKAGRKFLIFDPTDTFTPLGELRSDLQDSYGLLITDSGGELIHTPLLAPDANVLLRSGHFTLTPDGGLLGEVVETSSGDHASWARAALIHSNETQRLQQVEKNLNRSVQGFALQSFEIQHLKDVQENLVLTYTFATPQYGQTRGPLMLVRPRILGEKSFVVEEKPRRYPVGLRATSHEIDDYEIQLPEGYVVDDLPDPVKIDMGFARYQSRIEVVGSKIHYHREYTVLELAVPAERVAELRKLEGTIGADEQAAVVLKRAN